MTPKDPKKDPKLDIKKCLDQLFSENSSDQRIKLKSEYKKLSESLGDGYFQSQMQLFSRLSDNYHSEKVAHPQIRKLLNTKTKEQTGFDTYPELITTIFDQALDDALNGGTVIREALTAAKIHRQESLAREVVWDLTDSIEADSDLNQDIDQNQSIENMDIPEDLKTDLNALKTLLDKFNISADSAEKTRSNIAPQDGKNIDTRQAETYSIQPRH